MRTLSADLIDDLLKCRASPAANLFALLHNRSRSNGSGGLLLLLLGAGSNQASGASDGEDSDVLHNSN